MNIIEVIQNSLNDLAADFYQNFIEEERWRLLIKGLGNTIQVALFAVVIGIALGFLLAIIRSTYEREGRLRFLNAVCKIYITVIRGTPVLVQLLIIYYNVMTYSNNKVLGAVVAFGLNSAAYVAEIMRSGIMSVEPGQFEAGRCLGMNYVQTMWNIILPQAFKNVLPALANEFIVLLKETSVSGFIGLTDLTRGGDQIRSVTYSPLMPLLAVAAIYLILVMILSRGVGMLERRLRNNER